MRRAGFGAWIVATCWASAASALGPENVLLIVNRNEKADLTIANHYRIARRLPDRNVLYLDYLGSNKEIPFADFESKIRKPVNDYIAKNGLQSTVACWVTTPTFPYRIGVNSLSGCIFFGEEHQPVSSPALGPGGFEKKSTYYDSLLPARAIATGEKPRYLHMTLDAGSLETTLRMIDRSVKADGTHPAGTVYLLDGIGPRSSRRVSIPLAMRFITLMGIRCIHPSQPDAFTEKNDVLGVYAGNVGFPAFQNKYVPGALGDHLTSAGAFLRDKPDQMLAQEFLAAGCSATHGAVVEPFNYPNKFPSANLYVFYGMGFTAVESYWMSVAWPQQSLFLGDPLTCPFQDQPEVEFLDFPVKEVKGDVEIRGVAQTPGGAGILRVELFLDGRRISHFQPATIPADSKTVVKLPSQEATVVSKEGGTPSDLALTLRQQFVASGRMDAMPTQNDLVLLGELASKESAAVETKSTIPDLASLVVGNGIKRGEPKPIRASWALTGKASPGDVVGMVIVENKKRIAEIPFEVNDSQDAEVLVSSLVGRFQSKAPEGYQFVMPPLNERSSGAMISLVAPAEKLKDSPSAVLVIRGQPGSTLDSTLKDKMFPLSDPTAGSYDLAIIRFGLGVKEAHVKAKLPTAKLPDGRHRLRLVATRGWSNQSSAFVESDIVVRNGAGRLTLTGAAEKLSSGSSPTTAARAKLEGVTANEVEFFINGQSAGAAKGPNFELILDPSQWGLGSHEISARIRLEGGKRLFSDDAVTLQIVK